MTTREVVLCSPARTAIGTNNGSLKDVAAPMLGATVIRETLKRGIVTLCIGGGQGIALAIEML